MNRAKQKTHVHICPICEQPITSDATQQCPMCGWVLNETDQNRIPMRKYWRAFISVLENDPGYRYIDNPEPMDEKKRSICQEEEKEPKPTYGRPCPVCGEEIIRDEYDICPVCGWFLDPIQSEDPDNEEGANRKTVNQAKEAFRELREKDSRYRWDNDPENLDKKLDEITGKFD